MYGATAGRASLLKIPACVNQAICAVLPSKNYSPLFLKYYLDTIYQHLVDLSSGSARSNLSQEVLQKVKIPFPDLPTQLRIAAILGSIDEKIELNRKKIAELEALAKTIYDYWFVQFDFPDKNGKPYKSSGGKMVWNEQLKREIPDGWEVKPLGEIAIFSNGINYTTENQKGKKYRIVNVRDISAASLFIHGRDLSEITLPSAFAEKYVIPANCILIARSGIPGAIRLIANPQDTLYCGFIIICRPTIADSRPYLTYFMKSLEGSGATHKDSSILNNVSQDMLKRIYIPMPDDVTLLSFKSLMDDLFENIISLQTGIEETTILRDTLLPLLMNGQVEVKE
jgi:type I restriction enzyme S subunit